MIYPKPPFFILLLITLGHTSKAQKSADSLREANSYKKIAVKDIIGEWHTTDSTGSKISFVQQGNYSVYINGLNHGVGDYTFKMEKDSFYVNGTAANWPPYDCTLILSDNNTLIIQFYQFFSKDAYPVVYRRQKALL